MRWPERTLLAAPPLGCRMRDRCWQSLKEIKKQTKQKKKKEKERKRTSEIENKAKTQIFQKIEEWE